MEKTCMDAITPASRCTLAFFRKKSGDVFAAKLPEESVKPNDVINVTDMGLYRVIETVDLIDDGPAYKIYAETNPIFTAMKVFRPYWRRSDGAV